MAYNKADTNEMTVGPARQNHAITLKHSNTASDRPTDEQELLQIVRVGQH